MKKLLLFFKNKETRLPAIIIAVSVAALLVLSTAVAYILISNSKKPETKTPVNRNVPQKNTSSTVSSETSQPEKTVDINTFFDIEHDGSISAETEISKKQFAEFKNESGCNYIFITDLHADSTVLGTADEGMELAAETLKQAVKFANETDGIDFIAIAGDNLDSYGTKADYLAYAEVLKQSLQGCNKPIVFARGNHDNNKNKGQKEEEQLSNAEWHNLFQVPFNQPYYMYDKEVTDGTYFYFDIIGKKTRVVVLDSVEDNKNQYIDRQKVWLQNNVFTVVDEGWQYVIIEHYPLTAEYYDSETKNLNSSINTALCGIIRAINNKVTYNNKDYSNYHSHVSAVSYGHTHAQYTGYDVTFNMFMVNTPSCGLGFPQKLANFPSTKIWGRQGLEITNCDKYLLDVISVCPERLFKLRIGKGYNEEVLKK